MRPTARRRHVSRCNPDPADRAYMLSLAMLAKNARTACVYFKAEASECEKRAAARTDHPTIRYGGGKAAVKGMAKALVPPSASEGFTEVREPWYQPSVSLCRRHLSCYHRVAIAVPCRHCRCHA